MNPAGLELLKIVVQLAGAIIVSRLTVTWALGRHKSEKTWERKEAAFSDILDALITMERSVQHQSRLSTMSLMDFSAPEKIKSLESEFRTARQQYQRAISTAQLLLPDEVAAAMLTAEKKLFELSSRSNGDRARERIHLEEQIKLLRRHRSEIVRQGRSILGDPNKSVPDFFADPFAWFRHKNEIRKSYGDQP
ncbi:hypothetical protein AB9E06_21485 [Rhizobium leguminosarum]|uniref:hypothetical protein n=1 Tax=Rhizobium leguminosarum TaxID=384 RepID=UPI003F9752CB